MTTNIQGKITDIVLQEGGLEQRLLATISSAKEQRSLELPVRVKNEFDLIPYQSTLIGADVEYTSDWYVCDEFANCIYFITLKILSGPLKGRSYKATRQN